MTDQTSPVIETVIDAAVMVELTRQQEAGVKYLVGLNVDDLVAAISTALCGGHAQCPAPDRVKVARALCRQYEIDDGFSEEQADRAAASEMHRNFLGAADAAIAALSDTSTEKKRG
jgi:ABC-type polar amino acid transport system ATPase subunit